MIYYKNELYHHGILGQKWGVRRWQNPDGTFNEAGKERYFKGKSAYDGQNLKISKNDSSITKQVKKDYNNLSDKEFAVKYKTTKKTYSKRVEKYGDPYKANVNGRTLAAKANRNNQIKRAKVDYKYAIKMGENKVEALLKLNTKLSQIDDSYERKVRSIFNDYFDVTSQDIRINASNYDKGLANKDAYNELDKF